ncbi:MAG: ABC transporter ATP-binding protein [Chloroflexota bacterium]|nr:ABC transporter ATP-binding protein [Chloroflexota bacterium]
MSTPLVRIRNLSKTYGTFVALDDLNLDIEPGSIFGFIGPNGAGKTTTMRILSTLLAPTTGDAWIGDACLSTNPDAVRAQIGYMPDFFGVYNDMRVWEYLDFFAGAYKVPPAARPAMVTDLLTLVGLEAKRDAHVDELSRGMKQRLGLARTLVHNPALLILDEPASGLDPRARIELRELLKELRQLGKTVLISSHILTELAEVCTHVGIVERGRLLISGSIEEILRRMQPARMIQVRVLGRGAQGLAVLRTVPGVQDVTWLPLQAAGSPPPPPPPDGAPLPPIPDGPGLLRARVVGDERLQGAMLTLLVRHEIPVYAFHEEVSDLEDIFLRTTRGLVQ